MHTLLLSLPLQYAQWEEQQKDFRRARSVYERALDITYTNTSLWTKVPECVQGRCLSLCVHECMCVSECMLWMPPRCARGFSCARACACVRVWCPGGSYVPEMYLFRQSWAMAYAHSKHGVLANMYTYQASGCIFMMLLSFESSQAMFRMATCPVPHQHLWLQGGAEAEGRGASHPTPRLKACDVGCLPTSAWSKSRCSRCLSGMQALHAWCTCNYVCVHPWAPVSHLQPCSRASNSVTHTYSWAPVSRVEHLGC